MKKYFFFTVLLMVIFFSTSLYAQQADVKKFYVGAGGSYAIEDFDGGDFDNSWGVNAKVGYHLHPLVDIEFDFDYLNEFEDREKFEFLGMDIEGEADLNIMTYMIALKGYFPISTEKLKLSVVVGGGIMYADLDFKVSVNGSSISDSYDETELCGKVGLGLDFFATQDISFGIEGNYTLGFNDFEDIRYFNFTLGVAYHF
jgi:opacity protein-like surface antigen